MKLIRGLALIALVATLPGFANAATTATLTLSGTVPTIRYIGWGATPDAVTASDLDVSGAVLTQNASQTFQAPLQLKEVTNDASVNYSVTISSVNGGKLKHTTVTAGSNTIGYSLSVSGTTIGSLASPQTYTVNTSAFTGLTTTSRDVAVTVTGNPTAAAGRYADLISFSITAP